MPNPQSNLQAMWPVIVAFVGIVIVMSLAFEHVIEQRENPNASLVAGATLGSQVVLTRNRYGSYVAPGQINGQPVTFLVDTGASSVAMPDGVARRLGLERGAQYRSQTAAGITDSYETFIDSVVIGGIKVENVRGSIVPAMGGDEILLGMTVLQHIDFSQQGDRLVLEVPGSAAQ